MASSFCDVCKYVEEPSIANSPAVADAQIKDAHGRWGFLCESHVRLGNMGTFLLPRKCYHCDVLTKRLRFGEAVCGKCAGRKL